MAPNPRVIKACKAMALIGISPDVVKPVIKELLEVYDNNWNFIEENDYRVLTDAIFEEKHDHKLKKKGQVPAKKKAHPPQVEPEGLTLYRPPPKRTRSSYRSLGDSKSEVHKMQMGDELRPCCAASRVLESGKSQGLQGHTEEGAKPWPIIAIKPEDTQVDVAPLASSMQVQAFRDGPNALDCSVNELRCSSNLDVKMLSEPDLVDPMVVDEEKPKMLELGPPFTSDKDVNEGDTFCSQDEPSQASDSRASLVHDNDATSGMRQFDLFSSLYGDMKVSLLVKPEFGVPNVGSALKDAGASLSRKYGITESEFSVVDVFREFCNCLCKLESVNDAEGSSTNVGEHEVLKSLSVNNGTIVNNDQQNAPVLCSEVPRTPDLIVLYDSEGSNKTDPVDNCSEMNETEEVVKRQELSLVPYVCFLQENQSTFLARKYIMDDVSRGEEKLRVAIVNETNLDPLLPLFKYIANNVIFRSARVNFSLSQIPDGNCCSSCYGNCLHSPASCSCVHQNGGKFAYTLDGLLTENFLDECISLIEGSGKHLFSYCKDCPLCRSKDGLVSKSCEGHSARKFIKGMLA